MVADPIVTDRAAQCHYLCIPPAASDGASVAKSSPLCYKPCLEELNKICYLAECVFVQRKIQAVNNGSMVHLHTMLVAVWSSQVLHLERHE